MSRGGGAAFLGDGGGAGPPRGRRAPAPKPDFPPLHKDFYLAHPDSTFQCEEYCWGNLEAAHPVLSARSAEEVEEYRRSGGISVEVVRGRPAPKPFQTFDETSFPDFVIELAHELFTSEAKPFPVQAQVWPCALAGADVAAVAPTGSGKTLAFLLPALVHMMAQEPLQRGDGPIAIVIVPTRELAQQTLAVAARFCERTSGEDLLRAGAVFGGVDPSLQMPSEEEPDLGRWPELLVATPGRLLEMLRRRQICPRRVSYVVLDEADGLLSPRGWLREVKAVLAKLRPDRQLLALSATWPLDAEEAARELCGEELVRIRVDPAVPPIPQDVQLFPGAEADACAQSRHAALLEFLRSGLAPGEAVLVLCSTRNTAQMLAEDVRVAEAVGGEGASPEDTIANFDARIAGGHSAYQRFIRGEVRVLVGTFGLGSRGLDYSDTAAGIASAGAPAPLSLVVLLFDFPATINDYVHCIGRTSRPGQKGGRVLAFLPEMRFWIARELVWVLEHSRQPVPQELRDLVGADQQFMQECREAMLRLRAGEAPCPDADQEADPDASPRSRPALCGGDFDLQLGVWRLPAILPSYRRKLLHWLADELGLAHVSVGEEHSGGRRLHIALDREALPDKFFIEGEEVLASIRPPRHHGGRGAQGERHAVVVDPRVHRRSRTIKVRLLGAPPEDVYDVPVELVRLPAALGGGGGPE